MPISSLPFSDKSPWVYKSVADQARTAFDDPAKAKVLETALLNLYRLLERVKHAAFRLSYPPGVLRGGGEAADHQRPRYLALLEVEEAIAAALDKAYAGQDKTSAVEQLQRLIVELIDDNSRENVAPDDERLKRGIVFLRKFSSQLKQ